MWEQTFFIKFMGMEGGVGGGGGGGEAALLYFFMVSKYQIMQRGRKVSQINCPVI